MMKPLIAIAAVLIALALWPVAYDPPPELHVWVNDATGEYGCDDAVWLHRGVASERTRRPGFDRRCRLSDVLRDERLHPCRDCAEAGCLEMHVPMLGVIVCTVVGHRIRTKWIVLGPDTVWPWPYPYHREDGTPIDAEYRSDLRSQRDPDAWFRRLGRTLRL